MRRLQTAVSKPFATLAAGILVLLGATSALQAQERYSAPRTADGVPDLQGIWTSNTITPFERDPVLGNQLRPTAPQPMRLATRTAARPIRGRSSSPTAITTSGSTTALISQNTRANTAAHSLPIRPMAAFPTTPNPHVSASMPLRSSVYCAARMPAPRRARLRNAACCPLAPAAAHRCCQSSTTITIRLCNRQAMS